MVDLVKCFRHVKGWSCIHYNLYSKVDHLQSCNCAMVFLVEMLMCCWLKVLIIVLLNVFR